MRELRTVDDARVDDTTIEYAVESLRTIAILHAGAIQLGMVETDKLRQPLRLLIVRAIRSSKNMRTYL